MEVNIFPFVCRIYVVHCKFCNKYLGHLVLAREDYDPKTIAEKNFSWCACEFDKPRKKGTSIVVIKLLGSEEEEED